MSDGRQGVRVAAKRRDTPHQTKRQWRDAR